MQAGRSRKPRASGTTSGGSVVTSWGSFNFYLPGGHGIRELIDTFEVTSSEIRWMHDFPKDLVVVD
jgi:hypothetical protein